jgi:L-asparaginase/Glu-tRNA(Gln) amidotransferase subunit D
MIHIILLGGTISRNPLDEYNNSYIHKLVNNSRINPQYKIHDLIACDSIKLNDLIIIDKIIEYINLIKSDRVLILMGTDAMIHIAQQIKKNIIDKLIICTGAFVPYSNIDNTDSIFNFGCAFGIIQNSNLKPNVYICMNGQILNPDKSVKDYDKKIFFETD